MTSSSNTAQTVVSTFLLQFLSILQALIVPQHMLILEEYMFSEWVLEEFTLFTGMGKENA